MKHGLKLGIALMLSFSLVAAGCSSNGGNNGNAPSNAGGATNAPKEEAPIEITFAGSSWDPPTEDNNFVQKYLEQKYNVKIINMRVSDENFKLKIAANEIPDIFPQNPSETDMVNWAKQGVIASVSVDEIKQYMPKYVADVESVDKNAWDISLIDGKNYGIPRVWLNGSTGFIPTYNNDWLKAIGYSEPPKTIEEFEDVLTKFRNNDPDGNGQKDTYGMSGRGKNARNQLFNPVYAAFGVNPYQFLEASDGSIVYGGIMDESLEATKLLNKWYNAGLIDPEFMTDDNGLMGQKFSSKKIGFIDTSMYHHLFGALQGYKDSGIEPAFGKGLIGPAGKAYEMSNGALQVPLMLGAQVEKDEKKRIKILQILEDLATNDETYLTTAFGELGVSYEMKDGVPTAIAPYDTDRDKRLLLGIGGFYNPLIERAESTMKFHMTPEKTDFKAKVTEGNELITDVLGPTVLDSKGKYFANLSALQDEFYTKAIIAKNAGDVEKMFADFKAQWLKAGGQEILDEATKVYQERRAARN
ncbi:extracellular solute-binding protein [Paenibacillus harenae]|uniref:extracellular solute-binding protein n=1 Tax=Paenibacillus harenae TaxID=306543 RepID=UPI002791E997|nr:extracellular solute-binding protein [Paenibacillus harenae]MDQ0060295.1 putative aldouronate transport system substrate-binding protein [Paenibacillus harenae]